MILYNSLKLYTQKTNSLMFPNTPSDPKILFYLPENTTFFNDFLNLDLRPIDFKYVIIPTTKYPLTRLTSSLFKEYRNKGIKPLSDRQLPPKGQNFIVDLSLYTYTVDKILHPANYKARAGLLINNLKNNILNKYQELNYRNILLYSVNLNNQLNSFVNRKSFILLKELNSAEDSPILYDDLLLNTIDNGVSVYRLLAKDKKFNFGRTTQFFRNLKYDPDNESNEVEEESDMASTHLMNHIGDEINIDNYDKVKSTIKDYLKNEPLLRKQVTTNAVIRDILKKSKDLENNKENLNDEEKDYYKNLILRGQDLIPKYYIKNKEIKNIAATAIINNVINDKDKSKKIIQSFGDNAINKVDKLYSDDIIVKKDKSVNSSTSISEQAYDIANVVNNKTPEHIFEKRQIDFSKNLENDIKNSFRVLEKKELPLFIDSIQLVDTKKNPGELNVTDQMSIMVILKDRDGKPHKLKIDVPKIDEEGTFRINGEKKCLINQIVLNPLSFPKPYDSKFTSSYATFHIWLKSTKRYKYLEAYMSSFKLPLLVLMSFAFGFENVMKMYGIDYELVDKKSKKDEYIVKINNDKFLLFKNVNSDVKKYICNSFIREKVYPTIKREFPTKDFFNDCIINLTGRINSTFLIQSGLDNIVDPVVKQVLFTKGLPTELANIMFYMSNKVLDGKIDERNDISVQRIRNSEIIVHLVQKQILAAYTVYKEQYLSGNKDAIFSLDVKSAMSDFLKSEIVVNMEYANPIEEMSVKSRVTPVGKSIGGIPGKEAMQIESRSVHPSYYGNIDPLDTPEGGNVGMVQHLTVDAFISSSRGLFNIKEFKEGEDSGLLSTSTVLIPFVENDDGPRVMFSANQARQAVPLKNPEPPIVLSGYESLLTNVLSSSFIKKSPCDGVIKHISDLEIVLDCGGKLIKIDITPQHLKSGSGRDTLSVFKVIVKTGDKVKKNAILAEGSCVSGGSIALGRTLCVAFMPYKGYNYEDGIIISESLAKSGKLTSLHGIQEEVEISDIDKVSYIASIGNTLEKGQPLLKKTIGEISQILGFTGEDDSEDIQSGQLIKKSPGGKIVDIDVISNIALDKFPLLIKLAEKTRIKFKMSKDDKFYKKNEVIKNIIVKFKIEQELPIGVGDKLTNRHGAKGVIALVEKDEFMPVTPWGEKVEIITNPVGIIGRMNMGQLYEIYIGLISKSLAFTLFKLSNNKNKQIEIINKVISVLDKTQNKFMSKKFIENIKLLSDNKYKEMMDQIHKTKFFPIIIPPFKGPKQLDILKALDILGLKASYKLKLPEFGTETYTPVPVGYMYIEKLEHISTLKLHARSTGKMVSKTMQPTAGKSDDGGQRMGELDTYSLIGYNAISVLAEFFGPLSDDVKTKNEILSDILETGQAQYRIPQVGPTKELLNNYFISLMLDKR